MTIILRSIAMAYCLLAGSMLMAQTVTSNRAVSLPMVSVQQENVGDIPKESVLSDAIAQRLASVRQQIRAGATQLALVRLRSEAPSSVPDKNWHAWSVQHWSLLVLLERWEELTQLIQMIPPAFPAKFKDEAAIYHARAMMELGQATQASLMVRTVLESKNLSKETSQAGRSLLIDIYLLSQDFDNAQIEAKRFDEEFKPQNSEWFIQRALIALRADQTREAIRILAPVAAPQAKLLQVYARLLNGSMNTQQAEGSVQRVLGRKRVAESIKRFGEAVLVFARANTLKSNFESLGNHLAYIHALETYLVASVENRYAYLIDYSVKDLFDAYEVAAQVLSNQAQLLATDNQAWYELAGRRIEAGEQLQALPLYVTIIRNSDDHLLRVASMNKVVRGLLDLKKPRLIVQLFGDDSSKLISFEGIDSILASSLVNFGLLANDLAFVAALAPYIGSAPEGVSTQDWLIKKARINIFTGRFSSANAHISEWLEASEMLDGADADRILQLVFDLQAIDKHDLVLSLLDKIYAKTNSSKHQREILYWKAESFEAKGDLHQAANYYTQSAFSGSSSFDDWGQSSRFHAAEVLSQVGYLMDAERLYRSILKVTKDAARIDTIRQALQQLWLLQQG